MDEERTIEIDRSGVGHRWRPCGPDDLPEHIRQEIDEQIIDGQRERCDDYVATNGVHYRWGQEG